MGIAVGGLMTGIDTESMFSQLEEAYREPITVIEERKEDYEAEIAAYAILQSRLTAMKTAAEAMDTSRELTVYTGTSSDTTIMTASVSTNAGSNVARGTYDISVEATAKAHTLKSGVAFTEDEAVGTGTLRIQVGDSDYEDVAIDANDTIEEVAYKINSAEAGVQATAIYDGEEYYLSMVATNTGDENIINVMVDDDADTIFDDIDSAGLSRLAYDNFRTKSFDVASASTALGNAGTIEINSGSGGPDTITVTATDSLEDIAEAINEKSDYTGGTITAVVVEDDSGDFFLRVHGVNEWRSDADLEFNYANDNSLKTFKTDIGYTAAQTFTGNLIVNGTTIDTTGKDLATITGEIDALAGVSAITVADGLDWYISASGITSWDSSVTDLSDGQNLNVDSSRNLSNHQIGQNASITINGVSAVESASNTITDALLGVSLTVLDETDAGETVSVVIDRSTEAITTLINSFVTSYNSVIDFFDEYQGRIDDEADEEFSMEDSFADLLTLMSGEELEDEDETSEYGILQGDPTSNSIHNIIRELIYDPVEDIDPEKFNLDAGQDVTAYNMGLTLNYNRLEVDTTQLNNAMNADFDEFIKFFTQYKYDDTEANADKKGFAARMVETLEDMLDEYSENKGILITRQEGVQTTIESLETQIDNAEDRMNIELDILRSQFNALEVTVGELNSTSQYLEQQLAGLL
ncbi:Flagellar hook-associated protein 2 [Candidatus Magnetomoraceae bacterium gMMP-1]